VKRMLPILFSVGTLLAASTNKVDAVSSASSKYKVLGGTAYADSVTMTFFGKYSSATSGKEAIYLSYGTVAGAYDKQVALKIKSGSTNTNPNTIHSLKPETKYFYKVWSSYSADCANLCVGSFTTGAQETGVLQSQNVISSNFMMFPNREGVSLQLTPVCPYSLELLTIQGKVVIHKDGVSDASGVASFTYPPLAHGNYILKVTSRGVTLADNIAIK